MYYYEDRVCSPCSEDQMKCPLLGSPAKGVDASVSISRDLALTREGIVPTCVRDLHLIGAS